MNAETIDKIIEESGGGKLLAEDSLALHFAVGGGIQHVPKPKALRGHHFTTTQGYIDYLKSDRAGEGKAVVFVDASEVRAELDYMSELRQTATLKLAESEEFIALRALISGVNQKTLWRLMLTKLAGCIDVSLMLQTANLNIKATSDSDIQIQATGLENKNQSAQVTVTWTDPKTKGSHSAQVRTDWIWSGRIWQAFDMVFDIALTMEIDTDSGIKFIFHPNRLDNALEKARLALVDKIKGDLAGKDSRYTVHEGRF